MHACACAGSRAYIMVRVYITVRPPPWPAFFATSHHSLDIDRCVLHPESFNNKEQRGIFATFVNRLRD